MFGFGKVKESPLTRAPSAFSSRALNDFREDAITIGGYQGRERFYQLLYPGIRDGDKIDWNKNFQPGICPGGFEEGALNEAWSWASRTVYSLEASEITILWAQAYTDTKKKREISIHPACNSIHLASVLFRTFIDIDMPLMVRAGERLYSLSKKFAAEAGKKTGVKNTQYRDIAKNFQKAAVILAPALGLISDDREDSEDRDFSNI